MTVPNHSNDTGNDPYPVMTEFTALEAVTIPDRPGCSVEISRTAKGDKTWKVKAYRQDGESRNDALDAAIGLDEQLENYYYPQIDEADDDD